MNPQRLFDIELTIHIKEVEFTPRDVNDPMSTDEVFVVEATCNGHKLYDNDRYSLSEMIKVLEFVKEAHHKDSEDRMTDEAAYKYDCKCASICEAKWGVA